MADLQREPTRARADSRPGSHGGSCGRPPLTHLDHEERELETFYLENAEHPEVRAMEGEFRKQSPAVGGRFFAWIADGITPEARASIAVPGVVFAVLTGVFGRSYRREVAPVWK